MDSEPRPTTEGAADDGGPDPELLKAIARASRYVGAGAAAGRPSPVVRFDALRPGRLRMGAWAVALVLTAAGAAFLSLRPSAAQPARVAEADLRWAVAQVVREVEALRSRNGRLPGPEQLHGLVSERVVYEPRGDTYLVTGERDGVQVRYDGTLPLEVWLALPARAEEGSPP